MKYTRIIMVGVIALFSFISCKKSKNDSQSNTLRVLSSPSGQNQSITANIDNTGYTNFDPQTILAEGGSPLHTYTWSLDLGSNHPAGISIEPLTGVITRPGNSSTGLTKGKTTFKVNVSDGTSTASGSVDLIVTSYTPGPLALFQQLSSGFQLMNGEANKPYGASLFAMGGTPPYSWSLDASYAGSADLTNAGLTVDATGGIVRGTILNSAAGKTIKFKVIVTDSEGSKAMYSPVYTIIIK